jgi:hypothetical protein
MRIDELPLLDAASALAPVAKQLRRKQEVLLANNLK